MRHKKAGKKLNMNSAQRKALFRNLAKSLVVHESIRTTEARAKELRKVVERLVTYALKNTVAARREAYKVLGSHALVQRLFDEIGPRYAAGGGGYTRVIKLGMPRAGDCAPLAIIEFVNRDAQGEAEAKPAKKAAPKKVEAAPAKAEEPVKAEEPAEAPEPEEATEAQAEEAPEAEEAEKADDETKE